MDIIEKIDEMIKEINIERYKNIYPHAGSFLSGKLAVLEEIREFVLSCQPI